MKHFLHGVQGTCVFSNLPQVTDAVAGGPLPPFKSKPAFDSGCFMAHDCFLTILVSQGLTKFQERMKERTIVNREYVLGKNILLARPLENLEIHV